MKVAVIGAGGYVGGLLARAHSARGDDVHALARDASAIPALPGLTAYRADIVQANDIPDAFFDAADVVYHCAAEILHEPAMRAVNVDATRTLTARARGRVRHWVQLGSLSVYGTPRSGAIDEDSPVRPRSLYARTKLEADAIVEEAARGSFSHTLVRPAAVIGPAMRNRSMYALIEAVARGRFCYIGAPGAIGNYVHEANLVDALLACATHGNAKGRTYIVSQNITIERMVGTIADELGRRRRPPRIPEGLARLVARAARVRPGFPLTPARVDALTSRVEYRTGRIERELGYAHARALEDALRTLTRRWKGESA